MNADHHLDSDTVREKRCPKCAQWLNVRCFSRNKRQADGLQSYCKPCIDSYRTERGYKLSSEAMSRKRQRDRDAYKESPDKWWEQNLIRKYGITAEQYAEMLEGQQGLCAICLRPPGKKRLHVDHCHSSGRVRGLLCDDCNLGIGKLGDDAARVTSAAAYLQHGPGFREMTLIVQ
jgi:hypothetical protein